jgi:hypothetical protein
MTKTQEERRQYLELDAAHGGLIWPARAATVLGISRQRMHQLMQEHKIPWVELAGRRCILHDQLADFCALARTQGFRYPKPLSTT